MFVYIIALAFLPAIFSICTSTNMAPVTQSRIFTVGKQGSLEVQVNGSDIRLSSWDRGEIKVDAKVSDSRDLEITQVGEKVYVKYNTKKTTKRGEVVFDFHIPDNINVRIDALGGDVRIGDFKGDLSVEATGGNVSGGNIKGKGEIDSTGGDINVESVSGSLRITATGGDIKVGNVPGSIEVSSTGGDITASLGTGGGKSTLYSSGGIISLYLPETAQTTIDARIKVKGNWDKLKTKVGIRADFRHDRYEEDRSQQEIRATYVLNGGGRSVSVETLTVGIEIRKLSTGQK